MPETAYTHWLVRTAKCAVCGAHMPDPHHVRSRGALGKQVDEENVAPLCRVHHTECETVGRETFERKYFLNLQELAVMWWERYVREGMPDLREGLAY